MSSENTELSKERCARMCLDALALTPGERAALIVLLLHKFAAEPATIDRECWVEEIDQAMIAWGSQLDAEIPIAVLRAWLRLNDRS
jgi:hypothetical protein